MDPSDVGAPTRPRAGNGTLTRRVFTGGATRLLPRFHGGGVFAERRVLKGTTWALTPPYASARNRECPAGARRPGEGCYAGYSRISASSVVPVAWRRDDKWAPSAASRPSLSVGASNRPSSEPHTPLRRLRPPGARGQGWRQGSVGRGAGLRGEWSGWAVRIKGKDGPDSGLVAQSKLLFLFFYIFFSFWFKNLDLNSNVVVYLFFSIKHIIWTYQYSFHV
jgi:hypothetical protein